MKRKTIGICSVAVIVVCCIIGCLYYLQNNESFYYTQINNSKIKELPESSDMKYEYTLYCFSGKGKKKELKFKTSRELKEGAYLSLEVGAFGVHKWEEINYSDLPSKVQDKLK